MILEANLKKNLRTIILTKRHNDTTNKEAQNILILAQLKKLITKDQLIGIFWPLKGEPDLLSLTLNYKMTIPKIVNDKIIFINYKDGDKLITTKMPGLYFPISDEEVKPEILIIPALAYDFKGTRLGFGRGHYDRYLSENKDRNIIKIGVCYHDYLFDALPSEKHDEIVDYIITDKIIIKI